MRPLAIGILLAILLSLLASPALVQTLGVIDWGDALGRLLLPSLIFGLVLFAWLPRLALWFFVFVVPFAIMEALYVFRYERATDEHILAIIRETDFQESLAWLGWSGWLTLFVAVASAVVLGCLVYHFGRNKIPVAGRWRVISAVAGLLTLTFVNVTDLLSFKESELANASMTESLEQGIDSRLLGNLSTTSLSALFPWGVPLRIAHYVSLQSGMADARRVLADFKFGAYQLPVRVEPEVYVLVIGETGRPDRWQLNGYARPTNPELGRRAGVVSFNNATTGWAWTRMSVPVIVSRKPSGLKTSFFPERSVISAFKEAGFWTAWYSMHGRVGFHESAVALYASEANENRFLNPAGYRSPGAYDESLIASLDAALARPEPKKLIILHTMGSHFNYAHRTPAAFEMFRPSLRDIAHPDLQDKAHKLELNNSYDNSILYTDFVLAKIIDRLADTGKASALLYIADHGENLFDGDCDKSGHGHHTEYDFRTAAMWWNSVSYAEQHPEKASLVMSRSSASWSTENVFDTLLDAAGVGFPGSRHQKSLLDPSFVPTQRMTQVGLDFDKSAREPVCKTVLQNPRH